MTRRRGEQPRDELERRSHEREDQRYQRGEHGRLLHARLVSGRARRDLLVTAARLEDKPRPGLDSALAGRRRRCKSLARVCQGRSPRLRKLRLARWQVRVSCILRRGTFATTLACFVHSSKGNIRYHSRVLADVRWSAGQSSRRGRRNDLAGRFDMLAWSKPAASLFPVSACYEQSRGSRCWRGFPKTSRCIGSSHIDRGKLAKIACAAALQSLIPLASLNAING
jgi:hypothetical protein